MPEPSGNHDVPSQRAIALALTVPTFVNLPPMTRSPLGITAVAKAKALLPAGIACQLVVHWALADSDAAIANSSERARLAVSIRPTLGALGGRA